MRLMITIAAMLLVLLAACTSQSKIDAAVVAATSERDGRIAELQQAVSDLESQKQALEAQRLEAIAQFEVLNQSVSRLDDSLNDCTEKATACWADREQLTEQKSNLTKKSEVLQGWVDACQKTLDTLG